MRSLLFFVLGMLFLLSLRAQEENAPLCKVEFEITHDIKPPDNLDSYKVFIAGKNTPEVKREICHGEFISPGSYIFTITQPAYESVVVEKQIVLGSKLCLIKQKLYAKLVTINTYVEHDISPPKNLPSYQVFVLPKHGRLFPIQHDKEIRPGRYDLKITQPGYRMEPEGIRTIDILPSEKPYIIKQKMVAKKRQISFEVVDSKCRCLVDSYEIVNLQTNQKVPFRDEFQPGREYKFRIKFKKYETVDTVQVIPPGEGPYIMAVGLRELYSLEFTILRDTQMIDGINYEYTFIIDDKELEQHHIKKEQGIGRFYYTAMIPYKAQQFGVYLGYRYSQIQISEFRQGVSIGDPQNISIEKLIEHLDEVGKKESTNASLVVIAELVKNDDGRKILQQLEISAIDKFIDKLQTWELQIKEREILQNCIDIINGFAK